jgi:integrase
MKDLNEPCHSEPHTITKDHALSHLNISKRNRQQVPNQGTCMTDQKKKTKTKRIRVDVRMPDGKRISKVFNRKTDADKFRTEMQIEKYRAQASGLSFNNHISFREFATEWFETEVKNRKSDQTQRHYSGDLKKHIFPIVADVKLRDINIRHARQIENKMLGDNKHPRTINKVLTVFKTILNDAVKSDHLLKNPIRGYAELREPPRMIKFWTKDEASRFLEYTRLDPLFSLYVTALNTGMRLGEALGLCWDKVDFENNQIIVSRCLGRSGLRETTKTHEARFIPMNRSARVLLESLYNKRVSDKFIFCKSSGDHLDYNHVTLRNFKRSQVECGITKVIRFHDLRHTFASHFMMNGGNIYTLQQLLGHKDIQTTMIYAHLDKNFLQKEIELVSF